MRAPQIIDSRRSTEFLISNGPNRGMMLEVSQEQGGTLAVALIDVLTRRTIAEKGGLTVTEAQEFARNAPAPDPRNPGA